MKKVLFVIALSITVAGLKAQNTRLNAIKLNPLSLAFATGNIAYERAVGPTQSFQIGGFYSGFNMGDIKYSGFGVTPEYRFYFAGAKQALNGVYAGPYARYQNFNLTDKASTNKTTFTSYGGGAIIGWQKMWSSGFTFDLFAGPGYNAGKFKNSNDESEFNLKFGINGFSLRTGITVGFGF